MKRKARETGGNNLSFLDVISCGFGAVILLLVIIKTTAPEIAEATPSPVVEVSEQLARLQLQLKQQEIEVSLQKSRLEAERQQLLSSRKQLEKKKKAVRQTEVANMAQNKIRGQLELALQSIDEEMRRLTLTPSQAVGGIPADSRYIIFIVDTSGSMQSIWRRVEQELVAVLNAYPKVVGIQILDDMGRYMFPGYKGRWIPDTPGRRKAIAKRFRRWSTYSNSSPVEGIIEAIRTYGGKFDRVSLYVFGDDFSGSVQNVVKQVDRLNRAGSDKGPLLRIHAVGFGSGVHVPASFTLLMRELSYRNNGTFIGLQ